MEPSPPPPDDRAEARAHLYDAESALAIFLNLIRLQITNNGAGPLGRPLIRRILRALLVPAEALLRRAIYVLAELRKPLARPAPRKAAPPFAAVAASGAPRGPRPPVFCLTEPPRRPARPAGAARAVPQISIPGITPRVPARALPDPLAVEARFLRRLEAFEYAMNNPLREVERLLRRWTAARRKGARLRPLRPGLPSGLRTHHPDPDLLSLFEQFNHQCERALCALNDTS